MTAGAAKTGTAPAVKLKAGALLPGAFLVTLMLVPTALSLATVWQKEALVPVLLLDGVILVVALWDLWALGRTQLTCRTNGRDILSLGQKCAVTLELESDSPRTQVVKLRPHVPPEFQCLELNPDAPHLTLTLSPGRAATVTYHLLPEERGEFELDSPVVRVKSPLGFWEREYSSLASRNVRVYPDLAMIRTYEMLARKHRQYALVRASRLRGGESEFARLRDYTTDDNYRFIDWKATARRRTLTTREYQLESDQNIFFVLDAGRLMTGQVAGVSQFDWALNSTLLMSHVATRAGDRVGLMCFDRNVKVFLPLTSGPKATAALVRGTYALKPQFCDSAYEQSLLSFSARVKQRSMVILFTQLIDNTAVEELAQQLKLLSRTHLPLVVLLEDKDLIEMATGDHRLSASASELYRRGAAAELLLFKERATTTLKKSGAHVIRTSAAQLNNRLVNRYLEIKAAHAL